VRIPCGFGSLGVWEGLGVCEFPGVWEAWGFEWSGVWT